MWKPTTSTRTENGAQVPDGKGGFTPVDVNSHVLHEHVGLHSGFSGYIEGRLPEIPGQPEGRRYQIGISASHIVDERIQSGKADVTVLETKDKWFGVTYRKTRNFVIQSIKALVKNGVYPEKLF